MSGQTENNHNYSKFNKMTTEELKNVLCLDYKLTDNEDYDIDTMLYIMEVIAKREGKNLAMEYTDVDSAWTSFKENYLPYAKSKSLYDFNDAETVQEIKQKRLDKAIYPRRRHRLLQVAYTMVLLLSFLLVSTFSVSALGFDLWGTVAEWTKDTFIFSPSPTNNNESQEASIIDNDSFQKTLSEYGIFAKLIPTWFPDGYFFDSVNVAETPIRTTFLATYKKNDKEILIAISLLSESETSTFEKDNKNITVYTVNEIEYYIMTNVNTSEVVWKIENYECSITGSFSQEEAKKMIDSIYERK